MLSYGPVSLDTQTHTATYDGAEIGLDREECILLELFLSCPQHVLSCAAIRDRIATDGSTSSSDCIERHIRRLCETFEANGYPEDLVENIGGLGYRLKPIAGSEAEIPRPPTAALRRFREPTAVEYLVLDECWILRYLSSGAVRYSDYPSEVRVGSAVCDGFPEFVGLENTFAETLSGNLEDFELERVGKTRNPTRPYYTNFYFVADPDSQSSNYLFVFCEDASARTIAKQHLIQKSNEMIRLIDGNRAFPL